jgi:hypothetical protein
MDNLSNTVRLLDIFSDHYITCEQCKMAFAEMRDSDYCNTGMPLFKACIETVRGTCIVWMVIGALQWMQRPNAGEKTRAK